MVGLYAGSYCGKQLGPRAGKLFIRKDGAVFYFCSSKCQGNYKLGRLSRRVAWTAAGRKAHGKE